MPIVAPVGIRKMVVNYLSIKIRDMKQQNIINGEVCCWRCGVSQKDVRNGMCVGCSGWGKYYGNHMWFAEDPAKDEEDDRQRLHIEVIFNTKQNPGSVLHLREVLKGYLAPKGITLRDDLTIEI